MRALLIVGALACAAAPQVTPQAAPPSREEPKPREESPRQEELQPQFARPCEDLKALGSPLTPLDDIAADLRAPKRVAPRAVQFGFAPQRPLIVYVDPATNALRAISPDRGPARTLSAPGQHVTQWRHGEEPGTVLYEAGRWYQVSLDEPGAPPSLATVAQPQPNQYLQELRRAGVQHPGDAVKLSERHGIVTIYPPGGELRLHAYDAQTGAMRPLLPKDLRMEWLPTRLDDRRVVLRASGRLYVSDVVTAELTCATAPLPAGYTAWSNYAVTSDLRYLAHAAYRQDATGSRTFVLSLADLVEGTDTALGTFASRSNVLFRAVPGTSRFVLDLRRDDRRLGSTFYALDPPGKLSRLTKEIPKMHSFEVSADGQWVVFARGFVWRGPPIPPKPERPERPDRDDRYGRHPTCDPTRPGPGACGWIHNGCWDYVWYGFCPGTEPKPPPKDPADGLYVFRPM